MREIILDTETTGLDPSKGDRIIEIGCVELIDHVPTGKEYQGYFNPDREISQQAFLVHGLSLDFLKKYPKFSDSVKEFLDFIKDSQLVMHNASFDLGFLNSELKKCEIKPIPSERTTDTMGLAKKQFPGKQVNLDSLCKRFSISLDSREKHGALVDSKLLAQVYLKLLKVGEQSDLNFAENMEGESAVSAVNLAKQNGDKKRNDRKLPLPSEEELQSHKQMLKDHIKNPLWSS